MLLSAAAPRHSRLPLPIFLFIPSLTLFVAYLHARITRPSVPDYVRIDERESYTSPSLPCGAEEMDVEGRCSFPHWYGPGRTRYDAREGGGVGKGTDVLLFIGVYTLRCSRRRFG